MMVRKIMKSAINIGMYLVMFLLLAIIANVIISAFQRGILVGVVTILFFATIWFVYEER